MQSLQEATKPSVPLAQCAHDLLDSVPAAMRFIRTHMRRHRGAGLSVPQFRTLVLIYRSQDTPLSPLADHLGLSLPAVSRLVDALVAKGLVLRHAGALDRRQVALSLSSRGQTIMESARRATQDRLIEELSALSPDQWALLSQAMALLNQVFDPKPAAATGAAS